MTEEEKIQAYGCHFTLLSCSYQPREKSTFYSPRKNSSKISLAQRNTYRESSRSSKIFKPISDVVVTQANSFLEENNNVGIQTDFSAQQNSPFVQNLQIVNESIGKNSASLPLHGRQSILMGSGNQGMGGVINQFNDITLFEKGKSKMEYFNSQIPPERKTFVQKRVTTEQSANQYFDETDRKNVNLVSQHCMSSKTCKNSILKGSQLLVGPILKRSQMQETGFSKQFSVKQSQNFYGDTMASTNKNKNSEIHPTKTSNIYQYQQRNSIKTRPFQRSPQQNQPLSPPCSNHCKSVQSSGNHGDRTSSNHISIAASLNSSASSFITNQNRIFRTLKQMTLKNVTEQENNPAIFKQNFQHKFHQ